MPRVRAPGETRRRARAHRLWQMRTKTGTLLDCKGIDGTLRSNIKYPCEWKSVFFVEMDVRGQGVYKKKCSGEKIICFSNKKCLKPSLGFTHGYKVGTIIRNTWTWSWIWSWRSMRTVKKNWKPTGTMRLTIFSQPSVFIRGYLHAQLEHGWWHRAITIPPHLDTQIKDLRPNATGIYMGSIACSLIKCVP